MTPLRKHEFGQRLKARRLTAGWSVSELAEAAGVSRAYVNQLELGRQEPSISVASRLACALGLSLAHFEWPSSEPVVQGA